MSNTHDDIIARLLKSPEPSIRYKVRAHVLAEDPASKAIGDLRDEIRRSPRVSALLANRLPDGRLEPVHHVYKKWYGAHWALATLADIGYPTCDETLVPMRDQVLDCWLQPKFVEELVCTQPLRNERDRAVPIINGRARRCASQQANALFSAVTLGLMDARCDQLADCLIRWQWPDGGWNCDCRPEASTSSFWESLLPLRGLSAYVRATGNAKARKAAARAAELFLQRRLFQRRRDGQVMNEQFVLLHYPCYWRYDILAGLKVLAEAGFVRDERCKDALDLLESKRLPDGGWPAEERFYSNAKRLVSGGDLVSWGGTSARKMNEWVTADALYVLRAAGRL